MIGGTVLIGYGVIAPTGILIRNAVQGDSRPVPPTPHTATAASPTAAKVTNSRLTASQANGPSIKQSKVVAPAAFANKPVVINPAQMKQRREIMKLYAEWKDAWRTRDIDAIMSLYSPHVRFRLTGSSYLDHKATREALLGLWGNEGYTVQDASIPYLEIDGEQAVLIAGQGYKGAHESRAGQFYTCRYFLKYEDIGRGVPVSSAQEGALKSTPTGKVRQWRIIRNEYMNYQGSSDRGSEIY
jgi:hypothetical protein